MEKKVARNLAKEYARKVASNYARVYGRKLAINYAQSMQEKSRQQSSI